MSIKTYTIQSFFPEGTDRVEWAVMENDDYGHRIVEFFTYYELAEAAAAEWNYDEQAAYYAAE